jgi:hypothetical protein
MRVLTVLDSWKNKVYCYDVEGWVTEYEDYIIFRGHKLEHCNWLVTDSLPALYVSGVYYSGDSGE